MQCFNIIHLLTFFFPLLPPIDLSGIPTYSYVLFFPLHLSLIYIYIYMNVYVPIHIYKHVYKNHIYIYVYIHLIGLASNMRENMQPLTFWAWLILLNMVFSSFIHLPANKINLFFFMAVAYTYHFLRVEYQLINMKNLMRMFKIHPGKGKLLAGIWWVVTLSNNNSFTGETLEKQDCNKVSKGG
jgi:hypothetical protein